MVHSQKDPTKSMESSQSQMCSIPIAVYTFAKQKVMNLMNNVSQSLLEVRITFKCLSYRILIELKFI